MADDKPPVKGTGRAPGGDYLPPLEDMSSDPRQRIAFVMQSLRPWTGMGRGYVDNTADEQTYGSVNPTVNNPRGEWGTFGEQFNAQSYYAQAEEALKKNPGIRPVNRDDAMQVVTAAQQGKEWDRHQETPWIEDLGYGDRSLYDWIVPKEGDDYMMNALGTAFSQGPRRDSHTEQNEANVDAAKYGGWYSPPRKWRADGTPVTNGRYPGDPAWGQSSVSQRGNGIPKQYIRTEDPALKTRGVPAPPPEAEESFFQSLIRMLPGGSA